MIRTIYKIKIGSQHIISNSVCSPFIYKFSTFRFIDKRAFNICSKVFLYNELDIIRNIARSNGYTISSINEFINYYRYENTKQKNQILIEDYNEGRGKPTKLKRFSFPYLKDSFEKCKFKFKKFNIELIAKLPPKL